MKDYLPKDAENHTQLYNLHKSIGVVVLLLFFVRALNRSINHPPKLPEEISALDKNLAAFGHMVLYLLILLVPLSGYLMSNSFGYPVFLFSIQMPVIVSSNLEMAKFFAELHEISAFSLLSVVAVHILAVIKHRFFDKGKVNLLKRIV